MLTVNECAVACAIESVAAAGSFLLREQEMNVINAGGHDSTRSRIRAIFAEYGWAHALFKRREIVE